MAGSLETGQPNYHFIKFDIFILKFLSLILRYFLDILARVERWESESSESKDIELVEEISAALQGGVPHSGIVIDPFNKTRINLSSLSHQN